MCLNPDNFMLLFVSLENMNVENKINYLLERIGWDEVKNMLEEIFPFRMRTLFPAQFFSFGLGRFTYRVSLFPFLFSLE